MEVGGLDSTHHGTPHLVHIGVLSEMLLASEPGESWGTQWAEFGPDPASLCYILGPFLWGSRW